MFRISDFARLSRVSAKMLRHYDDIGLLKPAWVDPETEYRYYTADQLPRLNRIIALKDLGFRLDEIARLLASESGDETVSVEQLHGMLKLRRTEIERRLAEEQARLARVEARLVDIERELPSYDVVLRSVEPVWAATKRQTAPNDLGIERMFEEVERFAERFKARADEPPFMVYHGDKPDWLDVEVAVPLTRSVPGSSPVDVRQFPRIETMACVVHTGSYASLPRAFAALHRWTQLNGYRSIGPAREVYLRFSAGDKKLKLPPVFLTRDATEFVTEIQLPVSLE
jgi:DNA-binding transcriptional MerR regulator